MDVLVIYQFCTFGGVERAILNRVQAFRRHGMDIKVSVGYLYKDEALGSFQGYIRANRLEDYLEAFILPQGGNFDWSQYDLVSIIDTPQVLERIRTANNVFIECHTGYVENRQYLKNIPDNIRGVLVPSRSFKEQIQNEFPGLPPVYVIPNLVSEEFYAETPANSARVFPKRPLTYFARRDELKNFTEAVTIFESLMNEDEVIFFVIGYGADDKTLVELLEKKNLIERSFLRGRIGFSEAPYLTSLVKSQGGIFISPSKAESFGLSAAEFMSAGVPVLLSDIPAHRELVQGDKRFLYKLGDIASAKKKLSAIWKDWDGMGKIVAAYAERFRGDAFAEAWMQFMEDQKLDAKSAA